MIGFRMVSTRGALLSLLALSRSVMAQAVHGQGAEGSTMGPVAFLWPEDRPWSANEDNIEPCGHSAGVTNRTQFPIGSSGSVAFSIADEAYNVALRIAYANNPTTQEEFAAFHSNISKIEDGHQCYPVPSTPSAMVAGSNATIQLEYWANDSNKNESFFACADITFVEAALFTTQIPCFNVTATEFTPAGATTTPAGTANISPAGGVQRTSSTKSGGLSMGGIAGVVVGSIIGVTLLAAGAFMLFRRRGQAKKDTEALPQMKASPSM